MKAIIEWLRAWVWDIRWSISFARSQDTLQRMADEARADYLAGRTEPLDPESL